MLLGNRLAISKKVSVGGGVLAKKSTKKEDVSKG